MSVADAAAEEGSAEASGTSNVTKDAVHQLQVNEKIMAGESADRTLAQPDCSLTERDPCSAST